MHALAPKVPTAGPVHKQLHPGFHLVAVALVSLIAVAVFETPAHADDVLPSAWTAEDVGSTLVRGSATDAPCPRLGGCPVFSVSGAGAGVGGRADQFMFLYQKLTGDGVVTVRLLALSGASTVEAGLMIRERRSASARHTSILMGSAGGSVRSRLGNGSTTVSSPVARANWLRLARVGASITASVSSDGSQWTNIATQTLALPSTLYVGVVVTSRAPASLATATVSNMAVSSTAPTLPHGWTSADVGSAPRLGMASYNNKSFIGASSGAGFTAASDRFRFVYRRVHGDAKLSARVVASEGPNGRQAGIVLRSTLDPDAVEIALIADRAGLVLVRRAGVGQVAVKARVATALPPVMLQLDRRGSMVTASYSTDGATWKPVTSSSISLGPEIYAGLAVAAGPNGKLAAAAFDRLSLVSVAANVPPVVSLVTPSTGLLFDQGTPIAMTATAMDPDNVVAGVDFRVNGVVVASDTAAPYSATWTASAAGVYSIVAAASDFEGAVTESSPALITVTSSVNPGLSPPGQPPPGPDPSANPSPSASTDPEAWQLLFNASTDHETITYYVLDIYDTQARAIVASRNIGKPAPAPDGTCTVDINALVTGLPPGIYDAVVRAVASSGEAPSLGYSFDR